MAYQLAPGERVIVATRPQARPLVLPAVLFILIPASCAFAAGWLVRNQDTLEPAARSWLPAALGGIAVLCGLLLLLACLRPLLRWLGTRYVLTSRRLIHRRGWLGRSERQIPLVAIQEIGTRQSVLQRTLRSGNIIVDMGHGRSIVFVDVPEAAHFQNIMLRSIEDLPQTAMFDGAEFDAEYDQAGGNRDGTAAGGGEHG